MRRLLWAAVAVLWIVPARPVHPQATSGAMSEAEIESLRSAAYVPMDRLRTFEKILDVRAKRIDELVSKRQRPGLALDLHDAIDQFAGIVDELNDNLDEYEKQHRDVRKVLGHLLASTDRWAVTLKAPADDEEYNTVRKIALHNTADAHALALELSESLAAYFKEHPEAAAAEKKRNDSPHAPTADGPR